MVKQFYRSHEVFPTPHESMETYLQDYRDKKKIDLIQAAALDRDNAVSYRNPPFQVGSAILSKEPSMGPGEYAIHTGHNYKPKPEIQEGVAKRCAEKQALEKALANQTNMVVAIVSVSKEISTGDSTQAHDALHPCADCRAMIRQMKDEGLLSGESVVCNVNDSRVGPDGQWAEEERTVDELLKLYDSEDSDNKQAAA